MKKVEYTEDHKNPVLNLYLKTVIMESFIDSIHERFQIQKKDRKKFCENLSKKCGIDSDRLLKIFSYKKTIKVKELVIISLCLNLNYFVDCDTHGKVQ